MKSDPVWVQGRENKNLKKRKQAYRELREKYDLNVRALDAGHLALKHWQRSKWMPHVLDSRITQAIGREVWTGVEAWLYRGAGLPNFRKSLELDYTVWSGDNKPTGLYLLGHQIHWRQAGLMHPLRRKDLALELALKESSAQFQKRIQGREISSVGIKREIIRGQVKWFALLRIKGLPYRDPEYLAEVKDTAFAIDANCSVFAVVGRHKGLQSERIGLRNLESEDRRLKKEKSRERALDRSRRAANPECYDTKGRAIKGQRANKLSKRGKRLQQAVKTERRRARLCRRQEARSQAKRLISTYGKILFREELNYSTWPTSELKLGKTTQLTAPGTRVRILEEEIRRLGGTIISLNPYLSALSQTCLCGAKQTKEDYHIHVCDSCGLGPLDRDLFSAYLAYLHGQLKLKKQYRLLKTNPTYLNSKGNRRKAVELCSTSSPAATVSQPTIVETRNQSLRAIPQANKLNSKTGRKTSLR